MRSACRHTPWLRSSSRRWMWKQVGRLLRGVEHELVILLSGAFLLGAGAVYLPAYLYPPFWAEEYRFCKKGPRSVRGWVTPVVAEVTAGVRFTLPQEWEEGTADRNGNQWYTVQVLRDQEGAGIALQRDVMPVLVVDAGVPASPPPRVLVLPDGVHLGGQLLQLLPGGGQLFGELCEEIVALYEGKNREEGEALAVDISTQIAREISP